MDVGLIPVAAFSIPSFTMSAKERLLRADIGIADVGICSGGGGGGGGGGEGTLVCLGLFRRWWWCLLLLAAILRDAAVTTG